MQIVTKQGYWKQPGGSHRPTYFGLTVLKKAYTMWPRLCPSFTISPGRWSRWYVPYSRKERSLLKPAKLCYQHRCIVSAIGLNSGETIKTICRKISEFRFFVFVIFQNLSKIPSSVNLNRPCSTTSLL